MTQYYGTQYIYMYCMHLADRVTFFYSDFIYVVNMKYYLF